MAEPLTREQKEFALVEAANKASKSAQGFFLYHLSHYNLGAGKIRDLLMKMSAEDFDLFYEDEIFNLKASQEEGGQP